MKKKGPEHKEQLTPIEQLQQKPNDFFIVGIGASAGGIQALQEFFRHVPENPGMAYVVILHLSPDHDSQLAQILQRETKLPIAQVTEKTEIKPDHVYVVPPNRHLTMYDGYIAVSANLRMEERQAPVDIFFRTLADHHGPRAISVILSGTGANGSMGLKRIKERGGATYVQNPREAEFNEMPRNAIATELIDEVLNVADIPQKIITYKNNTGTVQISEEAEQRPENQQQALREIFTLLRHRTGHDFSNYKRPTLLRRIERRISVRNLPDLPAYAKFLSENDEEPQALLKDLLISVTNFFRDKKAFETVEQEIVPQLFNDKNSEHQVRIWVAGCATGEEAYSFAMLCLERTMGLLDAPKIQIFATDIDDGAIAHAREGYYTVNDLADVSQEKLRRFFNKEGDGYRVRREVRETVMFATHNFLKDPPFSHLDLISCRNVMIYLNQVAQERVVETFHFALKPGAFLFLGNSESVDGASDLYASYSREYHIFQSRQIGPRTYPVPESTPAFYFDKFKKEVSTQEQENKILERISFGDLHQQLLEEYAPPSLVVNEEYDILHLTERAGKYLQIGGGELSQNLLKLIKAELRLELRGALYQSAQRQAAVEARGLKVTIGDTTETVNIQVRPVLRSGDTAKGFTLIVFEPAAEESNKEVIVASDEPLARQMEEELVRVKAQLRASNEQHDFQAEEMKASNEELQAMNEELRSAAEELETSKEELQSINEELRTVNQELKVKIEETSIASNNLHNLINSTNIGTIFLDRSFRVILFTPAVRDIFNLRSADYGRPLTDITGSLAYDNLLTDAETVLEKLVEFETEVSTKNGGIYLMRITPYRTDEDRIKGVVITFVDITQRRKADEALRVNQEKYRTLFNSIDEGFAVIDLILDEHGKPVDTYHLEANPAYERHTGIRNIVGKRGLEIMHAIGEWLDFYGDVARTGEARRLEYYVESIGRWLSCYVSRIGGEGSLRIAIVFSDITGRKQAEDRQTFLLKLSDTLRPLADPEAMQGEVTALAKDHYHLDRCYYCEVIGENIVVRRDASSPGLPSIKGNYPLNSMPVYEHMLQSGEPFVVNDVYTTDQFDESLRQTCIDLKIIAFINIPVIKDGKPAGIFCFVQSQPRQWTAYETGIAVEIAERTWLAVERAKTEDAFRKIREQLQMATHAAQMGTFIYYPLEDRNEPDPKMLSLFGLPHNGVLNLSEALDHIIHPDDRERYANDMAKAIDAEGSGKLDSDICIIHPDGSLHWVNVSAQTYFEGTPPQPVKMPGVAVNITERKLAQQTLQEFSDRLEQEIGERTAELKENRDLLDSIFNTSLIAMSLMETVRDENGRITDFRLRIVNAQLEQMTGRTDLVGKLYAEEYPGIKPSGLFDMMLRVMETGRPEGTEYFYPHEGFNKWFSCMFVKIDDGLLATNLDISERKLAEEERLRNYMLLQQSEELAATGSWDYDLLTGTFTWSDGMYRLFNLKKGTEVRPEIYLQYATDDCQNTAARIAGHIKQGDADFEENLKLGVNGHIKTVKLKAAVIKNAEGTPVRVLGVDMDITATRESEEKMRQMEIDQQLEIFRVILRTQEEERRRISESLHNGLGQILYGVKMSLSLLSAQHATDNPKEFESNKRYTSDLLAEAMRDTRRISHELMPAVLEEFGLKAAVEEVCQQMQNGLTFTCLIDVDNLQIDKYMQLAVFRTLQELMLNVVKHAHATEARAEVSYHDQRILIKVSDNGTGIKPDKHRQDGIGLTSIRSKIDLLKGSADIQSEPGKGTSITILIPYTTQK